MNSAFLVLDLIAGDAGVEVKCDTRNRIDQKGNDRKMAIGLVVGQEG